VYFDDGEEAFDVDITAPETRVVAPSAGLDLPEPPALPALCVTSPPASPVQATQQAQPASPAHPALSEQPEQPAQPDAAAEAEQDSPPKKRGRGRPPLARPAQGAIAARVPEASPKKRGRGRPPKKLGRPPRALHAPHAWGEDACPKRRGRPPLAIKRGPGRPRKLPLPSRGAPRMAPLSRGAPPSRRTEDDPWVCRHAALKPGRKREICTFAKVLQALGRRVHEVDADGHCLFLAVAHQLGMWGVSQTVSSLRRLVADFMRQYADILRGHLSGEEFSQSILDIECRSGNARARRHWGSQREIIALCKVRPHPHAPLSLLTLAPRRSRSPRHPAGDWPPDPDPPLRPGAGRRGKQREGGAASRPKSCSASLLGGRRDRRAAMHGTVRSRLPAGASAGAGLRCTAG
jgi:hypothetical protein